MCIVSWVRGGKCEFGSEDGVMVGYVGCCCCVVIFSGVCGSRVGGEFEVF